MCQRFAQAVRRPFADLPYTYSGYGLRWLRMDRRGPGREKTMLVIAMGRIRQPGPDELSSRSALNIG